MAMMKKSNRLRTDRDLRSWIESLILTPTDERTLRSSYCQMLVQSNGMRLVCVKYFRGGQIYFVKLGGTADIPS